MTIVNVAGNLAAGWMLQRRVPRVAIIVGATVSMAACAAGIFLDGVPDIARLVLAGVYSAVIGVVPGCLFTAIPLHAPRPQLVGAATGLLMQVSNLGALLGPPVVRRDGAPVTFDTRKATALLALLAVTGREHTREQLADLLWPEADSAKGRASLRRTLSVTAAVMGDGLIISRAAVALDPAVVGSDRLEQGRNAF